MIKRPPILKEGCVADCPGCHHRLLSADESHFQKTAYLEKILHPWHTAFLPLRSLPNHERWAYRDKVCLKTSWDASKWNLGLMKNKKLIPIPDCPVQTPRINATIRLFSLFLPNAGRFPMVYYHHSGGQLSLVLKTREMPDLAWLTQGIKAHLQTIGIEGLWLHLHPSAGKRIFLKSPWHLIWGRHHSKDRESLIYGPRSFQQLLPDLFEHALRQVEIFFKSPTPAIVVDLYCGIGKSLRRWCHLKYAAIGVEASSEAVACARSNAPQAIVLHGKCSERIPQLDHFQRHAPQEDNRLVFANPPRTGLEAPVTDWIIHNLKPDKIAYLSCSAGTLKRDLTALTDAGYAIQRIQPYDFFPQTHHVETLTLLRRGRPPANANH